MKNLAVINTQNVLHLIYLYAKAYFYHLSSSKLSHPFFFTIMLVVLCPSMILQSPPRFIQRLFA